MYASTGEKPWTLDGLYNPNLVVHPSYYQWVSSSQLQLDWTYLPYLQLGWKTHWLAGGVSRQIHTDMIN